MISLKISNFGFGHHQPSMLCVSDLSSYFFSLVKAIPYADVLKTYGMLSAIEQFASASASQIPLAIESATCGSLQANDMQHLFKFLPQALV